MATAIANRANFVETVSGTSHSSTLTLSAGTSRKVVVAGVIEAAQTLTAASFDGNSMPAITSKTHTGDGNLKIYAWYYDVSDGTGAGSKTVTVTSSDTTVGTTWYAWQLSDAATGAPEYGAASEVGSVTTISDTAVAVSEGAAILAVAFCSSGTPTFNSWAGVTESVENKIVNYNSASADATDSTAGTKTVSATTDVNSGNRLLVVVSVASGAPALTTKLKLLAHPSAASATGVEGVVLNAARDTVIGEFSGQAFEADLTVNGESQLLITATDISPDGATLTTSDHPLAVAYNTTITTGLVTCDVVEV